MERIRVRGVLRVGYDPNNPPFSFFNAAGDLVGFDLELSQGLAEGLGVRAEMIPVRWPELSGKLAGGVIDVMPSV
jgi:ABC-type amino acid transport substrate-binding protein